MSGGEATRRACSTAAAAGLGRSRTLLLLLGKGLLPLLLQVSKGLGFTWGVSSAKPPRMPSRAGKQCL